MSKKSDDSIERIFRQALTQYETTFQESDWEKMEKLLNEEAIRRAAARSKRIKGTAYTLTGLTGLIIAVYFLAFRNPSGSIAELNNSVNEMQATGDLEKDGIVKLENPPAGLLSETPSKSPDVPGGKEKADLSNKSLGDQREKNAKGGLQAGKDDRNSRIEGHENDAQVLTKGNARPGNETIEGRSNETSGANLKAGAIVAAPVTGSPGQDGSGNGTSTAGVAPADNDNSKVGAIGIISATVPAAGNSETTEQITTNSTSTTSGEKAAEVAPDTIKSTGQKDALASGIDSLENAKAQPEEKQRAKPPYRWSIGIILAPEFSTTSLNEYSEPGGSFGLRIGYQVSNRLNIKTGIIRSTKKYEGDGYDYTPRNPLYWNNRTNGVVPEAIDSKCLVYELPVGLQFDAIQTQKSRVFLSAALSSYFMISQAYDYTFESPNPGADMGWRSSGSESYWFSVGMVSAGYERYVHRSFAIGIEPYLKISLHEIGWPNIKLFSGGAYVTLRYRFMKSQK